MIDKTKEQLVEELNELRLRVAELEKSDLIQRQIEKRIQESEKKFRTLFENATDAIYIIDPKTQKILDCNPKAAEITGCTIQELKSLTVGDVHPVEEQDIVSKIFRKIAGKGSLSGISGINQIRKDGSTVPVEVNASTIDIEGRRCTLALIRDITTRKHAEEELKKREAEALARSKAEFEAMFNSIPDAAIYTDTNRCIVMTNPAAEKIFGYFQQDLQGKTPEILYATRSGYEEQVRKRFNAGADFDLEPYEMMYCRENGSIFIGETLDARVVDSGGKTIGFIGIIRDVSKRKEIEQQLQAAAITDDLTGLFNRRGFLTLSEQQRKIADRTGRLMSLLYLDLDGMKAINDEHGHKEGDQALVDTANILKRTFRESDIIGRIGGDEFAVFLTYISEPDIQHVIINHIQENLRIHNQKAGRNYKLFLSIGIAYYNPEQPCSINELLTRSDQLMYKNKKHKFEEKILKSLRGNRIEHRAFERFQPSGNYRAKLNGSDKFRIKNISSSGLCLKTTKKFSVDTHYKIRMVAPDNKEIKSTAIVVWSAQLKTGIPENYNSTYYETGLKFVDLSDSRKGSLQKFINNLIK